MPVNQEWLAAAENQAAHHEAGHAVMAMAFGCKVLSVAIRVNIDGGKTDIHMPQEDPELDVVRRVLLAAAGAGAEVVLGKSPEKLLDDTLRGFGSDEAEAEKDLQRLGQSGKFFHYVLLAAKILGQQEYWQAIQALAREALRVGQISDPAKLAALALQVPQLDDSMLVDIRKTVSLTS